MAKIGNRRTKRRAVSTATPSPPGIKLFRPVGWFGGITVTSTTEYVSHLLRELGRLGLEIRDIERHDRPPHTKTVLSDLMHWLDEHPGPSFANLEPRRLAKIKYFSDEFSGGGGPLGQASH
jgi:hypothetical protein